MSIRQYATSFLFGIIVVWLFLHIVAYGMACYFSGGSCV